MTYMLDGPDTIPTKPSKRRVNQKQTKKKACGDVPPISFNSFSLRIRERRNGFRGSFPSGLFIWLITEISVIRKDDRMWLCTEQHWAVNYSIISSSSYRASRIFSRLDIKLVSESWLYSKNVCVRKEI